MTISKTTCALALGLAVLIGVSVVLNKPVWLVSGLVLVATGGGWKARKILRHYLGQPPGFAVRTANLTDLTGPTLGQYYVHAGGRNIATVAAGVYCRPPFDADGIPLVDYGPPVGQQHNVCTTAQYALEHWAMYLQTGDQTHRATFLKQADWLLRDQQDGKWYYRFELESRRLGNPWISAMAQGQGISVLLRAWQCTDEEKYLKAARRAFAILEIPIDQGGVLLKTETGTWLEEYPTLPVPDHVLNGHIWALFGVWDMHRATGDATALRIFREGIAVLKAKLAGYDSGYWVWYDLGPRRFLVDGNYMHFQIDQLRVLHAITGEATFADYANKWAAYQKSWASACLVLWQVLRSRLFGV